MTSGRYNAGNFLRYSGSGNTILFFVIIKSQLSENFYYGNKW